MDILYLPKGPAKEYALLGLNIYKGCTHRCKYCYCANNHYTDKEEYFTSPNPKKDLISRLRKDCEQFLKKHYPHEIPEILISFLGDVYQPAESALGLTRRVIEVLIEYQLTFTILTKGGNRVIRDFDLLAQYPRFRLGMSICLTDKLWVDAYEPGAPSPGERMEALKAAKDTGIPTWISLEPIIDPMQAMQVIRECHEFVDHWKIGKLRDSNQSAGYWEGVRRDVTDYLKALGADYYIKKSLYEGDASEVKRIKNKS